MSSYAAVQLQGTSLSLFPPPPSDLSLAPPFSLSRPLLIVLSVSKFITVSQVFYKGSRLAAASALAGHAERDCSLRTCRAHVRACVRACVFRTHQGSVNLGVFCVVCFLLCDVCVCGAKYQNVGKRGRWPRPARSLFWFACLVLVLFLFLFL
jgi:hypothetical protein